MPLIRVDVTEAFTKETARQILDVIHHQVVDVFKVPKGDRYQILSRHSQDELILEDTGLGFERTANRISIQVFSRPRAKEDKVKFYKGVVTQLEQELGIQGKDVLISIFENSDADWSFGFGEAQFLTGDL